MMTGASFTASGRVPKTTSAFRMLATRVWATSIVERRRLRSWPAPVLAGKAANERSVREQVAPPHPPRLLRKPPRPLKSRVLHQAWSSADLPRDDVERASDAHREGHAEAFPIAVQPELLLRA